MKGGKSDFRCCSEVIVEVLIWLWRNSVVAVCWNEAVVVKSLINSRKHSLVLILNVVRLSVYDCFSLIFDNICMEKTWVRKKKKKKKLYSSTYVVTTKVSVYNIFGIIWGTVHHYFFNVSSRKRDGHFYTCSSEPRIGRALCNVFYLSHFKTLRPGTVSEIELARSPVLAVKRFTDWARLPRFREFTVKISTLRYLIKGPKCCEVFWNLFLRSVSPFMFCFCDIKWVKVSLVSVQIGIFLFWYFVFACSWIFA